MFKNISVNTALERVILSIVGLALFFRLLVWRFIGFGLQQYPYLADIYADKATIIIELFVLVVLGLYLLKVFLDKGISQQKGLKILPIGLFTVCAISLIYSIDKNLTMRGLSVLSMHISLFYVLIQCLNSRYRINLFLKLFISTGLFVSLLGLLHYFAIFDFIISKNEFSVVHSGIRHMLTIKRIGSVFGWPTICAGFLILIIPLSFTQIFLADSRQQKWYTISVTFILMVAMFFTYTITSSVSLIAAALISLLFFINKIRDRGNISIAPRTKLLILSFICVLIACLFFIISKRVNIFTTTSFQSRLMYLRSVLMIIKNHPLLGTGFNTFKVINTAFISASIGYSSYAHNSYLQLWSESGVMGFAFLLFILYNVISNMRNRLKSSVDRKDAILSAGILCSVLAFCVDNLFNFTMLLPDTSLFWWIFLAICFSFSLQGSKIKYEAHTPSNLYANRLIVLFIILVLFFNAIYLIRIYKADSYLKSAVISLKNSALDRSLSSLSKARKENPADGRIYTTEGIAYLKIYKSNRDPRALELARSRFKKAIELRPTVASNYASLGKVSAVLGDKDKAKAYYQKAYKLAPYNKNYKELAKKE